MDNLGVTAEIEKKFEEKEQKKQDIEDLTKKMLDLHKKYKLSETDKTDIIISAAMILSKQLRILGQTDAPDIFVSMVTWVPNEKNDGVGGQSK